MTFFVKGSPGPTPLGEALGKGLGSGLSQGIQNFYNEKSRIEKGRPKVQQYLSSLQKQFGLDESFDDEKRKEFLDRSIKKFEEGQDPFTAAYSTVSEIFSSPEQLGIEPEPPKTHEQVFEKQPRLFQQLGEALTTEYKPPESEKEQRENIPELLEKAERGSPADYRKFLEGMTRKEFLSLPRKKQFEISKTFGDIAQEETSRLLARGAIPGYRGVEKAAEESAGLAPVTFTPESGQKLLKTTGELAPLAGMLKLAGLAPTLPGKVAATMGLFPAETAFRAITEEKRAPTVAELAISSAVGGITELAAPIIKQAWSFFKGVPGVGKNISSVAKATNITEEEVAKKVSENLAARNINPMSAVEGNPEALSALKEETNKAAKVYNEAKKANIKQLEKVRKDVAKKLPESPLAKYYKPKKEVISRPETILKEQARVKPLKEEISKLQKELTHLNAEVIETENYIRANRGSFVPEEFERAAAKYQLDRKAHQETLDKIRALNFEIKYKKHPVTSSEIKSQIDKSFSELTQAIKDPSISKLEKVKKQLSKDKEAIEIAERLAKRGEIPGKEVFDEYIKIHEQYNKAYGDLAKELKQFIRTRKPLKHAKAINQRKNAEDLLKTVQEMKKANDAKILIQKDKRKAMQALDKPSGAFYREMLKDLGKEVEGFRRDYFKWHKLASPSEKKTTEAAFKEFTPPPKTPPKEAKTKKKPRFIKTEEQIKESAKVGENPTKSNQEKLSRETGETKENIQQATNVVKDQESLFKKLGEKIREGSATEKDIQKSVKSIWDKYKKVKPLNRAVINGVVIGGMQALVEQTTGWKPPSTAASLLALATGGKRGLVRGTGSAFIAGQVYKFLGNMFEDQEAKLLKSKRNNFKEYNLYKNKLKTKYSSSRVNRILKKSKEV